jgi:hypothetical protein
VSREVVSESRDLRIFNPKKGVINRGLERTT